MISSPKGIDGRQWSRIGQKPGTQTRTKERTQWAWVNQARSKMETFGRLRLLNCAFSFCEIVAWSKVGLGSNCRVPNLTAFAWFIHRFSLPIQVPNKIHSQIVTVRLWPAQSSGDHFLLLPSYVLPHPHPRRHPQPHLPTIHAIFPFVAFLCVFRTQVCCCSCVSSCDPLDFLHIILQRDRQIDRHTEFG
jgi:hypothetical protein